MVQVITVLHRWPLQGSIPAIELEKTTLRTVFLFLATLLSTLLVPFTAGSIKSLCTGTWNAVHNWLK
jgi:hypothetical protein